MTLIAMSFYLRRLVSAGNTAHSAGNNQAWYTDESGQGITASRDKYYGCYHPAKQTCYQAAAAV